MNLFFYIFLFIFGTLFGSFASVIIYRLKSGEKGILGGRSHCGSCNNVLNFFHLIPIFSWIIGKGKCFYCNSKISGVYPTLEITTGILFALIGYFIIDINLLVIGNIIEIIKLFFWLFVGFISIIYTYYDILFLEIHEGVGITGIAVILLILGLQTIFPSFYIVDVLPAGINSLTVGLSSILLSTTIIGMLYLIMLKEFNEIIDILILLSCIGSIYLFKIFFDINLSDIAILNGVIGALGIFIFFFLQIIISSGAWMGGGDLRIAILIGLILGISLSFAGTMITYIVGSMVGILLITHSKIKKGLNTKFNTQVPFGPFLAVGFFTTIFLKEDVLKFIEIYFQNM